MAPRHVLVIDDQPSIVHFLRCSLEERWLGCSVDVAQTSRQARALLRHNSYDVVVTDYQLHDGNGLQLAALVKERLGPVPVVLMTASPPAPLQAPSGLASNGITAMLRKPFDLAQLFDIIETAAPGDRQDAAYA
jgi:two-component system, NtrC family, response regulator PilR